MIELVVFEVLRKFIDRLLAAEIIGQKEFLGGMIKKVLFVRVAELVYILIGIADHMQRTANYFLDAAENRVLGFVQILRFIDEYGFDFSVLRFFDFLDYHSIGGVGDRLF